MANTTTLDLILMTLLIVGGINWGLVGLFDLDLVAALFGEGSVIARLVYILVGVSGLYFLLRLLSRRDAAL